MYECLSWGTKGGAPWTPPLTQGYAMYECFMGQGGVI